MLGMVCLFLWTESVHSQSSTDRYGFPLLRGVVGSLVLPTSDFAEQTVKKTGPATPGAGIGVMVYTPLANSLYFSVGAEARFTYNKVNMSSLKSEYGPGAVMDVGSYKNLWLLGGLHVGLGGSVGIRGLAGFVIASSPDIGICNMMKKTDQSAGTDIIPGYGVGITYHWIDSSIFTDVTWLYCQPEFSVKRQVTDQSYEKVDETIIRQESMISVGLGWSF